MVFLFLARFIAEKSGLVFAFLISGGRFPASETLRPLRGQPVAVLVQVDQREGRAQPLVIFPDATVTNLGKSEDTLQDAKRMLDFGSHAIELEAISTSCSSQVFSSGVRQ
jgi:hypothetical protein